MLYIEKLNKSFKDRQVLQDLTLYVAPGEIYGLLGANGAGKTTTINIICNLLQADSGIVKVNHQLVSEATKKSSVSPHKKIYYTEVFLVRKTSNFLPKFMV